MTKTNAASLPSVKNETRLILITWFIILAGIGLRLDQYLFNRSLWLDEAFFAVNFLDSSFWQILELPLDYSHNHIAPPGFMLITQVLVDSFGNHDYILRLYPLFCGTLSLIAFYFLARKVTSPAGVLIAVFLFAVSDRLIVYSSEFKQYSGDVLFAVCLLWLGASWQQLHLNVSRTLVLTLTGAIVVWFSYPVAFILATIGSYWGLQALWQKQWKSVLILSLIALVWAGSFMMMYHFISNGGIQSSAIGQWLVVFWREAMNGFAPSPLTAGGRAWIINKFGSIFNYPASLGLYNTKINGLPVLFFLLGCFILLPGQHQIVYFAVMPVILAFTASHFELYPIADRLVLFLLPVLYLVIAEAIVRLQVNSTKLSGEWVTPVVQAALVVVLVSPLNTVFQRSQGEQIHPLIAYLQAHQQPQDKLYLYHWAEPAFRYYAPQYGMDYSRCQLISPIPRQEFTKEIDYYRQKRGLQPVAINETNCILGVGETYQLSVPDLEQLQGQGRVWFLFSHYSEQEAQLFLQYLDSIGQRMDTQRQNEASLYLYDLP